MLTRAVAVVSVCGCAGERGADLPLVEPIFDGLVEPICDGSEDARLVYAMTPGFGNPGDRFTAVNGDRYLVVTGQCEYVIGDDTLKGMRRGVLEPATADELSSRLHFGRYVQAADFLGTQCPEGAIAVLADTAASLVDIGCGDEAAPQVWQEAFREIWLLYMQLEDQASYDWTSTRVLPVRFPEPAVGLPVYAWNAELDWEDAAVDSIDLIRGDGTFEGVLVTDAAILADLEQLRRALLRLDAYASELFVKDSLGRTYQLLLRDELPGAASSALRSALDEALQRAVSQ